MMNQASTPQRDSDLWAGLKTGAQSDAAASMAGLTQCVSFAIGNDQYGVDIMAVREIKGSTPITQLPRQADYVRGVLNLRGVMVPILDLRCRFGQGLTEATAMHVVIVVQIGSRQIGLLADRVLDIVSFQASQVQAVPRVTQSTQPDFLSGLVTIESQMIALIDLASLLSSSDVDVPSEQPASAA